MYSHAWNHSLVNIPRIRSVVIDPGAWGYTTTPRRDSVDHGNAHSARFWNSCQDVDSGQPRLLTALSLDTIEYVDFKLFHSSLRCEPQWALAHSYLSHSHERVFHVVNDQRPYGYALFAQRLRKLQFPNSVHVDVSVRLDREQDHLAWRDLARSCIQGTPRSLVVNCIWRQQCTTHVYTHPQYESGAVIVKPY
jgi:hypothetical protein